MNFATITLIVIIVIVVAVVAWLIYKAGFKAKEITVKAGLLEARMERDPNSADIPETPQLRTEATQEALQGGRIEDASIKAPADAGARLQQKAEGEGSSITGSDIQLNRGHAHDQPGPLHRP